MSRGLDEVRVGFLGGGAMGEALAAGVLAAGARRERVRAADPDPARRKQLEQALGIVAGDDNASVVEASDVVVLAVKPGLAAGVLGALGLAAVGTLLAALSLAARFREFLLPVLLFPLVLPVLVLASRITGLALAERDVPDVYWAMLALYDWVFVLIGYFVFDSVLEE